MERYQGDVPSEYKPRYNIAPGQKVLTITRAETQVSEAQFMEWGISTGMTSRVINARVESIHEKPLFRSLFQRHRCLIPASGYYEWKHEGSHKTPYYLSSATTRLISFAGLIRPSKEGDQIVILTTEANPPSSEIHDRKPVILNPPDEMRFLTDGEIIQIGAPLGMYEVSPRVNGIREDSPDLIIPWRSRSVQQAFGDIE